MKETPMREAINHALFGWYPYLCLTVFLLGSLVRFDREQYTWRSGSSQMLRKRQLFWGSNLFHFGILVIFFGNTLLVHRRLFDPRIRKTSSFGDIAILLLLYAQLILGLCTITVSLQHLDGVEMVRFMSWAQGVLTLQPDVAELVADAHPIFKAHLVLGMTLFLLFPFTR